MNKPLTENHTVLNSVGCVISKVGMTYALLEDGENYDDDSGVHILDVGSDEWFEALDEKDVVTVNEILIEVAKSDKDVISY